MHLNGYMQKLLKQRVAEWLKDKCDVLEESHAFDETGAPIVSWSSVQSDVPCRMILNRLRNTPVLVGDQDSIQETYRVALPIDVVLRTDQRILMSGVTYAIVAFEQNLTDQMTNIAYISRRDGALP